LTVVVAFSFWSKADALLIECCNAWGVFVWHRFNGKEGVDSNMAIIIVGD
jgi:hypothetical protein